MLGRCSLQVSWGPFCSGKYAGIYERKEIFVMYFALFEQNAQLSGLLFRNELNPCRRI